MIRSLLAGALAALLAVGPVLAQDLPPVSAGTRVLPDGASQPVTLGTIASGSRYLAQRDYVGLWKPFGSNLGSDSAGTIFPTGKTAYMAIEVEDDFTAVQLVFGNQSTSPYTVTSAAVSGSSQLASPGYGGGTPGISPYDGSGSALSSLAYATFANGGANTEPYPPAIGSNCLVTNAAAANGSTSLGFASVSGVAVNQVVATTYRAANTVQPQTLVSALTSTSVTLSQGLYGTLPSGSTVCFLATGITVPAATVPPVQTLARSDWIPVTSYGRIDSPVVTGGAVIGTGIAARRSLPRARPP